MDPEDAIWNRALGFGAPIGSLAGDVALSHLLNFHGLVMNGGLLNAVESSSQESVDAAISGYQWIGLDAAARAIASVRDDMTDGALDNDDRADALESSADALYAIAVPMDATIQAAFHVVLRETPLAFKNA